LVPAILLRASLFGGQDFVPFDLTTFAPWSLSLDAEEVEARKAGSNWDITEKPLLCSPEYRLAKTEIAEGRFPHWNPYARFGAPLFANALDGFCYPSHWLFFWFSPERAYGLAAWLAFALAGIFMFGFLRTLGLRSMAALFGALTFQLSGTLTANAHFFMRMETLIWLPAGFWALTRLSQTRGIQRIPSFVGFTVSLCLCWLAGFPPFALAVSLCFGLYILFLLYQNARMEGRDQAFKFGLLSIGAIFLGILSASIQLLPMLDYFPHSQRELSQNQVVLAQQGFDALGWFDFVMPSPFGDPTTSGEAHVPYDKNPLLFRYTLCKNPETGTYFVPNYNYTEYALYLGVFPFVFLILSFFGQSVRFRLFALFCLLFILMFSLAGHFHRMLSWLPVFQSTPPMRFMSVVAFFGASLAAMGYENGTKLLSANRRRVFLSVVGFLAACFMAIVIVTWASADSPTAKAALLSGITEKYKASMPALVDNPGLAEQYLGSYVSPAIHRFGDQALRTLILLVLAFFWILLYPGGERRYSAFAERSSKVLGFLVIPLTVLEMMLPAMTVNPSKPHRVLEDTPAHTFLREKLSERRHEGGFTVARASKVVGPQDALPPNLLNDLGIRDLNAYAFLDKDSGKPLIALYGASQTIRKYWFKSFPLDERLNRGIFDLYGVRYLLSKEALEELGAPAMPPMKDTTGNESFFVYERKTALPRAFLAADELYMDYRNEEKEIIQRMIDKHFDPQGLVLIQERMDGPEEIPKELRRKTLFKNARERREQITRAKVSFHKDENQHLHIEIEDSPGAWLVLADTALPHWKARVDTSEATWYRAYLHFRTVWIPVGDHKLTFDYDPKPFQTGLYLAALANAILLLLMAYWNGTPKKLGRENLEKETVRIGDGHGEQA